MRAAQEKTGLMESEADLERQLAAYFAGASKATVGLTESSALGELRQRVIDGVVERIFQDWAGAKPGAAPSALRDEVLERLIERVLQQFGTHSRAERALPS